MDRNTFLEKLIQEREALIKTKEDLEEIEKNKDLYLKDKAGRKEEKNTIKKEIQDLREEILKKDEKFLKLKEQIFYFKTDFMKKEKAILEEEYKKIIEKIDNLKPEKSINLKLFIILEELIKDSKKFSCLNKQILKFQRECFKKQVIKIFNKCCDFNDLEITANLREIILIEKLLNTEEFLFSTVLGDVYKEIFFSIFPLKEDRTDILYLEWEFENLNKQLKQIYPLIKTYVRLTVPDEATKNFAELFYNEKYNEKILTIFRSFLEKIGEIFSLKLTQVKSLHPDKFDEYFKRYIFFCETLFTFFRIRLKNPLIIEYLMDIEIPNIKAQLSDIMKYNLSKIPENILLCIDELHEKFSYAYLYDFSIFMRFSEVIKTTFYAYMKQFCQTIKGDIAITRQCIIIEVLDDFNEKLEVNLYKMIALYPFSAEYYLEKNKTTFENKEHHETVNICLQNITEKLKDKMDSILKPLFEGEVYIQRLLENLHKHFVQCNDLIEPLNMDLKYFLRDYLNNQLDQLFKDKYNSFKERPEFYQLVSQNLKSFAKVYSYKLGVNKLMNQFEKENGLISN